MKPAKLKKLYLGLGLPKICVPISERSASEVIAFAGQILSTSADLVEWRLDYFDDVNDSEKIRETAEKLQQILGDLPLVISLRDKSEGGHAHIDDLTYQQLTSQLISNHLTDAVELNWSRPVSIRQQLHNLATVNNVPVLESYYNMKETPSLVDLKDVLGQMANEQVDFIKLAVQPNQHRDILKLMEATLTASETIDQPLVSVALGPMGTITRLSGRSFNSAATFADLKRSSLPGHLSVEETRQFLTALDETGISSVQVGE